MSTICYKWNDNVFTWKDCPFTWKEGCVIEKIVRPFGGPSPRVRERLKTLTSDERKILINLFIRLEVDEIVIEKRVNKQKNTKVKIKLKDVQVLDKLQKKVNVNVKIL